MTNKSNNKINIQSTDIFKQELAKFTNVFPQFVKEGNIDFDAFKAFLDNNQSDTDNQDKYDFTWSGKKDAFNAISRPSFATLTPKKEESVNFDTSENLFIEGDNLEVLKLLQANYYGKIKMIYIDPPYNTGKDFIYKDNFKQNKSDYFEQIGATKDGIKLETNSDSNGRYHSAWLSMMYPRLFLAKQLLRDDGVIFVSIDDNEQHHLKLLMNEVFGEDNFLSNIVWEKRFTRSNNSKTFASLTEYLLCFRRSSFLSQVKASRNEKSDSIYSNPDNDDRGLWTSVSYVNPATKAQRPNLFYELKNPITNAVVVHPTNAWKYKRNHYLKHVKENKLYWGKDGGYRYPRLKKFLSEMDGNMVPVNLWKFSDTGTTDEASKNLEKLMSCKVFDFPKPYSLIQKTIDIGMEQDDIILDFFAGSATTGHAVMDLNKQDGGKRKFILVQIPEATDEKSEAYKAGYQNIAEIGKERLRRAIEKHNYQDGFKVFELSPSNYNFASDYAGDDTEELIQRETQLADNPLVEHYTPGNLVYEILLKEGFSLNSTITQKDDFYIVTDSEREQSIYLTLVDTIDVDSVNALNLTKDDILVCFDKALTDTEKVNFSRNFQLRVI